MATEDEFKYSAILPLKHWFSILCLLFIGLTVSLLMFFLVRNWEQTNQRNEFESWAKAYANAVENTLNEYVEALLFLGDFFDNASAMVTRGEFTSFVKSVLPRYPGIQAFGWDPLVKDTERALYESAARKEGFPDYEFTERTEANTLIRAGRRDEYVVVYYLHPLEGNRPAFGFDIASNRTRLSAIAKGFKTGKLTSTERITLVQETGNQFGILLLLPIYHQGVPHRSPQERWKSRKGFVVEVLRVGKAVETALNRFSDEGISLALYDMSADEGTRLLYHRPSKRSKATEAPIPAQESPEGLIWSKTFDFGQRPWKILMYPSDFYSQSRKPWEAWMVLFGAFSLTALLTSYMLKKNLHAAETEQRVKKQDRTNQHLQNEIKARTSLEAEREKTILDLQQALDEVKTLRGILPLCSFCKKVRDDTGYWEQVDVYIHKHSQADVSHSICPDCAIKNYPEIFDKPGPDQE